MRSKSWTKTFVKLEGVLLLLNLLAESRRERFFFFLFLFLSCEIEERERREKRMNQFYLFFLKHQKRITTSWAIKITESRMQFLNCNRNINN